MKMSGKRKAVRWFDYEDAYRVFCLSSGVTHVFKEFFTELLFGYNEFCVFIYLSVNVHELERKEAE